MPLFTTNAIENHPRLEGVSLNTQSSWFSYIKSNSFRDHSRGIPFAPTRTEFKRAINRIQHNWVFYVSESNNSSFENGLETLKNNRFPDSIYSDAQVFVRILLGFNVYSKFKKSWYPNTRPQNPVDFIAISSGNSSYWTDIFHGRCVMYLSVNDFLFLKNNINDMPNFWSRIASIYDSQRGMRRLNNPTFLRNQSRPVQPAQTQTQPAQPVHPVIQSVDRPSTPLAQEYFNRTQEIEEEISNLQLGHMISRSRVNFPNVLKNYIYEIVMATQLTGESEEDHNYFAEIESLLATS